MAFENEHGAGVPGSLAGPVDVLVIDDEDSIREGCRQALEGEGYRACTARDGSQGISLLSQVRPRVVLLDLRMPGVSGIEVLERIAAIDPSIVPIVITGYGTVETAVASMKLGAFDFLAKPFDTDQLLGVVDRGLRRHRETAAPAAPDQSDAVLKGLEALGDFASAGPAERSLADQLRELEIAARRHAEDLGAVQKKGAAIASLAADLRLVDAVIARHDYKKSALIQIMLDLQAEKRWLPRHMLAWTSRRLNVPLARLYQIAGFYEAFSLKPQGRHTVQVCLGTACHVRRAPEMLAAVAAVLGIGPGETDPGQRFTLKAVHCLGCCALAPVVKVDERTYSNPSLAELRAIFASVEEEEVSPCRS